MTLKEELRILFWNAKKEIRQLYDRVKQNPLTSLLVSLIFIISILLLITVPHWQVSEINNTTEKVAQENQNRATLAQIIGGLIGGVGLLYGIYMTVKNIEIGNISQMITAENIKESNKSQMITAENIRISNETQKTENFTRAIDQLGAIDQSGNPAIEIRLGGIYALGKIADESKEYCWPIMEILTAYIRKNSKILDESEESEYIDEYLDKMKTVSFDIQAIITIIRRSKSSFNVEESNYLDLKKTDLRRSNFQEANLRGANLEESNLKEANLQGANLKDAKLMKTNLYMANLGQANLYRANFKGAKLLKAKLTRANLQEAILEGANLEGADLRGADMRGANLQEANLRGSNLEEADLRVIPDLVLNDITPNTLTIEQLSKVKTLYQAKLDPKLEESLREKYLDLFNEIEVEP